MDDLEQITPERFHTAGGTDDWRVLYWGAHAFFAADGFSRAAAFAAEICADPDVAAHGPDVDIRREGVAVKLITRERRDLTTRDVMIARSISAIARSRGLNADPSRLQIVQTAVASVPSAEVVPFWKAALGYVQVAPRHLADPLRRSGSVVLQGEMPVDRVGRGRFHVDVCVPHDQVEQRVAAVLAAGGRMADDSFAPEWWTLADAENHGVDITSSIGRGSTRIEEV